MLSRRDIEKELGKGLCLYPLKPSNIKENSINLTISQYAWCQRDATVYWYGENQFSLNANKGMVRERVTYGKGQRSIFKDPVNDKWYLILLPHQTTIIETEEVIGIGENIGGAVHSKVGIVVQGIGDTGTMLGPGYCGHLMVSLHNITDDIVSLEIGETFVSLTFDYLNTRVTRTSATVSSHYDRLLEHGCILDSQGKEYFMQDWKSNFSLLCNKMFESKEYVKYKNRIKKNQFKELRKYVNKRNITALLIVIFVFAGLYSGAIFLDAKTGSSIWVDRFWNVGCSGIK